MQHEKIVNFRNEAWDICFESDTDGVLVNSIYSDGEKKELIDTLPELFVADLTDALVEELTAEAAEAQL